MTKKIYLCGIERKRGKSFVSTSFAASLLHIEKKTRCFKLFDEIDKEQFKLLETVTEQNITPLMGVRQAISEFRTNSDDLLAKIINYLSDDDETPICYFEGTDFCSDNDMTEFQFNLTIASQLNCEVVLVVNAKERSFEHLETLTRSALVIADKHHAQVQGIIFNQISSHSENIALTHFSQCFPDIPSLQIIPEFDALAYPSVEDIARVLHAEVLYGEDEKHRQVRQFTVAAKNIGNFLTSRASKKNALIITPDDRMDILLGSLLADQSMNYPKISGVVLTGGEPPCDIIKNILSGLKNPFPVLLSPQPTYETATALYSARFALHSDNMAKVEHSIHALQPLLAPMIMHILNQSASTLNLSPAMFLHTLKQKVLSSKKHIVLPEGDDPRILKAAHYLLQRDVVQLSILGHREAIDQHCKRYNLDLSKATLIEVEQSPKKEAFANLYYELRKHKNINYPIAFERMSDPNYFGAMMVYTGMADGMVSGAIHTTADTVRPALEIIKTNAETTRVSSIFIMCLPSRILIYGDCAINPEPDSQTLAEIAHQAAITAQKLGIEPKVALLSYSSGSSGQGESVEKVKEAAQLLQDRCPKLVAEGPIQYDAAVDENIAKKKLPNSKVAGQANVLIFPDLNTGNNTYKAVQRETGALAIGPVLLGLNKPVNDLSRGCLVEDVINTILITAIQAQEPNQ